MASIFQLLTLSSTVRLAFAWSCNDAGASEQLTKVPLGAVDRLAVCNDGTEAAYYLKDNGNPKLWLVYLSGGGWCYDAESCAARANGTEYPHHDCKNSSSAAPCFLSSKDYTEDCGKTGIFDTDSAKSPLHATNKVYIPYCSSDGFMGDGAYHGWQFRGARIVRAVLQDLSSKGLASGSKLVFGGGSAGGRGAMVLLDEVAEMFPKVVVRGFLDSPYYVDVPSFSSKFEGFQPQHVAVLKNFNASSVVSRACAKQYPGDQMWKCLFGQYRMPFVKTPYMLVAAQFDAWQLSHLVHGATTIEKDPNFTTAELKYVTMFGKTTLASIKTLPSQATKAAVLYSTGCFNHHMSEKTGFWSVTTTAGSSTADVARVLLDDHELSHDQRYLDTCTGYNCGRGCSAAAQPQKFLLV